MTRINNQLTIGRYTFSSSLVPCIHKHRTKQVPHTGQPQARQSKRRLLLNVNEGRNASERAYSGKVITSRDELKHDTAKREERRCEIASPRRSDIGSGVTHTHARRI